MNLGSISEILRERVVDVVVVNSTASNDRQIYWMNLSLALPCTADAYEYCAYLMSGPNNVGYNFSCEIGIVNGKPIYHSYNTKVTHVYSVYNSTSFLENATETQTSNGSCPATYATSWSNNEPKVYYNDPNLP